MLGHMVREEISSELDHWVCDLGWSCVWVLVLEEGVCTWVEVDQKEGHG